MNKLLDRGASDWVASAILLVVCWEPLGLLRRLDRVPASHARSVYTSSGVVMAILAGFTVSALFYFATTDAATLENFRQQYGRRINRTLVGAFLALVACVAGVLSAGLASPSPAASWLFVGAGVLAASKMVRISFLAWFMLEARYVDSRTKPVVVDDDTFRRAS